MTIECVLAITAFQPAVTTLVYIRQCIPAKGINRLIDLWVLQGDVMKTAFPNWTKAEWDGIVDAAYGGNEAAFLADLGNPEDLRDGI